MGYNSFIIPVPHCMINRLDWLSFFVVWYHVNRANKVLQLLILTTLRYYSILIAFNEITISRCDNRLFSQNHYINCTQDINCNYLQLHKARLDNDMLVAWHPKQFCFIACKTWIFYWLFFYTEERTIILYLINLIEFDDIFIYWNSLNTKKSIFALVDVIV